MPKQKAMTEDDQARIARYLHSIVRCKNESPCSMCLRGEQEVLAALARLQTEIGLTRERLDELDQPVVPLPDFVPAMVKHLHREVARLQAENLMAWEHYSNLLTAWDEMQDAREAAEADVARLQEERDEALKMSKGMELARDRAMDERDRLTTQLFAAEAARDELAGDAKRYADMFYEARADLKLNAAMLAKQCDIARDAEAARDEAQRQTAALRAALEQIQDHRHASEEIEAIIAKVLA